MYVCLPVLKWALPLALAMLESSCSTYTGSSSSGNASHHDSRARYQQKQCFFWPYSAELCCFFKICVFCRKFCRHYPPDPNTGMLLLLSPIYTMKKSLRHATRDMSLRHATAIVDLYYLVAGPVSLRCSAWNMTWYLSNKEEREILRL